MKINRGLAGSALTGAPVARTIGAFGSHSHANGGGAVQRGLGANTALAAGAGSVQKALVLGVHSDGSISITSDADGGKVDVGELGEDGKLAINEVLSDGSTGDSFEISVSATPVDDQGDTVDAEPTQASPQSMST